ncbi:hypothetical protein JIN85_20925 [Luteolibacter pohnpeiensis]|uniref:Uncharacterized protein n=1 Tax=Luteolibacter pohnpeiensis TaxID=454153 RepID=A0A934VWR5_9BACT|nr:hypothetical protein [Luteolibacter pohnpeiensis]MBK1884887.1 hypothetical protein [Luteolibacter pohnpeiensis]
MADAYELYLPSGFPDDLNALLDGRSLQVTTKAKKIGNGLIGSDHLISSERHSMNILEAPPTDQCQMRYLLCIAKPKAKELLLEVTSFLESLGARNTPKKE